LATGSGGRDHTIRVWRISDGREQQILEGHTAAIRSLSYSHDGRLLASKSIDDTVRIWHAAVGRMLAVVDEPMLTGYPENPRSRRPAGLAFHPSLPILATLGAGDTTVRLWDVDADLLLRSTEQEKGLRYTTARIALFGDSGVGKTGLGWRLSHLAFKEQSSTHGQQFWVMPALGTTRSDGTECEAMLWDLAGQPDYRLVHALFLDDVDLALILFDPGNRQEAFRGVEYWLKALSQSANRARIKILVGARLDRAEPLLTIDELADFCSHHGITGGYIGTSAATGRGLEELLALMKRHIPWDTMVATVTTATFKRVKDFVLMLKESRGGSILLDPKDLRSRLDALDPLWQFTEHEMMVAVQHLANHGYVAVLRGSDGGERILMAPEILTNLASSFILEARRNPRGLGALEEERLLRGNYQFPETANLTPEEVAILIDGVALTFLQHNLCFRETLGTTTFLIFPALINQKSPSQINQLVHAVDDVSYAISGTVENIYASLVVLLGYTNTFARTNQWQNQAQYEINSGEVCGFRQTSEREGGIQVVHYYSPNAPPQTRALFQALFESFLRDRNVKYTKYPAVHCPQCSYMAEREEVVKRINEKKGFLYCGECAARIALPLAIDDFSESAAGYPALRRDHNTASRRTTFESALVRVKAFLRDRLPSKVPPNCFVSYAWGGAAVERRVSQLAADIQDAGIRVVLDRKDNAAIGASVARFISSIETSDFVVAIGTPAYREKYENQVSHRGSIVAAEIDLINVRLTGTESLKTTVLPLLFSGDERTAMPPLMRGRVYGDFRDEANYFESLLRLVFTLHSISFDETLWPELLDMVRAEDEL
jgi:GTPase SAR1 family protein